MARFNSPLDDVRIAAPCSSDWNQMTGDERVRFCRQCSLNVYNLSGMTRREAERLISNAEGRLCVRYYRRPDGTILTRNCPPGLRAIKRRLSRAASATLSAVLGFLAGLGIYTGTAGQKQPALMGGITVREANRVMPYEIGEPQETIGEYVYEEGKAVLPVRENSRERLGLVKKARRSRASK